MRILIVLAMFITAANLPAAADDMLGKQVYKKWCYECHAAGKNYPGTWMMAFKSGEAKAVLTERKDLSADFIRIWVRQGGGGMPLFRRVEISDSELDAIIKYLKQP